MSVRIIVDSACDITQEEAKQYGVEVLPLTTTFGAEEYLDGVTLTPRAFFEKLIETDVLPKTSQVTPFAYQQKFREVADAGDTAVCITLSSKLSGCYQSAVIALEGYSDRVVLVDSENVCVGEQILVRLALSLREEGKSAREIAETLERKKKDVRLIALLDTLEYLKKGGRISSTVAFAGGLLSIKPVISIENGEVVVLGKARGSKNGHNLLSELVRREGIDFNLPFRLVYSGLDDSLLQKYVRDNEALYQDKADQLPVSLIGSTIGTYAGPGAIGAAFFVHER